MMKIEPFRGKGNDICDRCYHLSHNTFRCTNSKAYQRLIKRTVDLEKVTRDNPLEYKRLDSYWAFLIAMSELNECEDSMRIPTKIERYWLNICRKLKLLERNKLAQKLIRRPAI